MAARHAIGGLTDLTSTPPRTRREPSFDMSEVAPGFRPRGPSTFA